MKKVALVIMVVMLAAIVPQIASAKAEAKPTAVGQVIAVPCELRPATPVKQVCPPKAEKPKVAIKVKVNIGRSQDRRYDDRRDRRDKGGIKIALGKLKVSLSGRDSGYRSDYRSDDCDSGSVRIPFASPNEGLVPYKNSVRFIGRDGSISALYVVTRISGEGVYGRVEILKNRPCRDDDRKVINNY